MPPILRIAPVAFLVSTASASTWRIETIAGTGVPGSGGDDGPASAAQINDPYGVVRGPDGAIWFCEHNGHRIRRIATDGTITTVVGTGERGYEGDGGPATVATLNLPHELRFDHAGNLYIADTANHAVRRVNRETGIITTMAGCGARGYEGDGGPATQAKLSGPHSIQFGRDGELYVCDVGNHAIRVVDPLTGIIRTYSGTGRPGPSPDGSPITGTPLNNPRSLDVDSDGRLWLVTREGNQVLMLDPRTNMIHHIAGTGEPGFTGNGGPARLATLSGPKGIALDREGNAWLADTESHSVRVIRADTGTIELMAGTGIASDGSDGDPLACAMNRPHGVFADQDGSVFIGDSEAHRIRVLRRIR
ncbi:MAG: hypothetical protein IAE82_04115 [Opitutaceae bacterium]|nr:hypothetical protein [Opitutaceae bacterium]